VFAPRDIADDQESRRGHGGWLAAIARRQPVLSKDEELSLAARTREGDSDAAERLIASHLRCVVSMARRYSRFDLPVADLMQEGALALTQAVQKFNPDNGVRLATYARAWIRSAMQDYAVRTWSLVRIGAGARQRRLFLALRRMANDLVEGADALTEKLNRDAIANLARQFEVPAREVISIARRLAWPDTSLDRPVAREGDDAAGTLVDRVADDAPTPEEATIADRESQAQHSAIGEALAHLTPRERLIVTPLLRYYDQSEADFYGTQFTGAPAEFSSDYRISSLTATSYGIKLVWLREGDMAFDVAFERYVQDGKDSETFDGVYPEANIVVIGARKWF